ncbi:hypothetical protein IAD21_00158 [Abditibacteriota bacterium]|nr:hypothetical protein IAD21_00158 [Abditibacteriota bacterium]
MSFSDPLPTLDQYNVVWAQPSEKSSDSMPCGGGDIGLNVWVEGGDVLFYLSRSGTFDDNNQMLKLGRVRLQLAPNPLCGDDFRQELDLKTGAVEISGGGAKITLWVDVFRPVVHVELESEAALEFMACYENWRYDDHLISGKEFWANSYKEPQDHDVFTLRDSIACVENEVRFFHRNGEETIFDLTVRLQGMKEVKDHMFNPLRKRTFGGAMRGENMVASGQSEGEYAGTKYQSWTLKSASPATSHWLEIALHVAQTETLAQWQKGLNALWSEAKQDSTTARRKTLDWWAQLWERSFIFVDGDDPKIWEIGRNYQLFRYQLACNAYGEWPTKFNGGLFTFDPGFVDETMAFTPDYRRWGGGTMTAQNQRLVYFPLLKSGDFDFFQPQFDFYLRSLRNAELRSETYWNHRGAAFTEQIEQFGLPNICEWGAWNRPEGHDMGLEYNRWLEYQWDTVFEFCLMMLETHRYIGCDVAEFLPLIESCLTFFDEHYRMLARERGVQELSEEGHYILFPGSCCETYKIAYNSASTIAALRVILERILALPAPILSAEKQEHWREVLKRIPPIPLREIEGQTAIAPAIVWQRRQNSEVPQLYPVFPWGIYGVGKPDLEIARQTYCHDPQALSCRSIDSWRQTAIFAARLGLTEEAAKYTLLKMENNPNHRFSTFWGPGFDWTPDHNWGGSGMIGLQEMLLQIVDEKIYLLPAWPLEWNVHFKLHAPQSTTVEARVQNGQLIELKITPESRAKDVVLLTTLDREWKETFVPATGKNETIADRSLCF